MENEEDSNVLPEANPTSMPPDVFLSGMAEVTE